VTEVSKTPDVPLASAIEALREELVTAVEQGADQKVRFALGPIELDFEVEITSEGGLDAGVRFWVVSLGAKGSRSSAQTHRVHVSLSPVAADDTSAPLIVGSQQAARPS
jgi:hypothetical protein